MWEGAEKQGWTWAARRAEQVCHGAEIHPSKAVSALDPSPGSFSSIIHRGWSSEAAQRYVRGLTGHLKDLQVAETLRAFPNCVVGYVAPLGGRVKDKVLSLTAILLKSEGNSKTVCSGRV